MQYITQRCDICKAEHRCGVGGPWLPPDWWKVMVNELNGERGLARWDVCRECQAALINTLTALGLASAELERAAAAIDDARRSNAAAHARAGLEDLADTETRIATEAELASLAPCPDCMLRGCHSLECPSRTS